MQTIPLRLTAAKIGDLKEFDQTNGTTPFYWDAHEGSALHAAVDNRHFSIAKKILAAALERDTYLHSLTALFTRNISSGVTQLIGYPCDKHNKSLLRHTVETGNALFVASLLAAGAYIDEESFRLAIESNNKALIESFF